MAKANCLNCDREFRYSPANKTGKYCSCQCSSDHKRKEYVDGWLRGEIPGGAGFQLSNFVRNHLLQEADYKCSFCGWNQENPHTGKIPLHIDHIDGDPFNHCVGNLRVLCPNCHSLTETFGSKNRGRGRYSRGYRHPKHTVAEG
jgi:hypothetical protein